jgi:hypothetical protein
MKTFHSGHPRPKRPMLPKSVIIKILTANSSLFTDQNGRLCIPRLFLTQKIYLA